MSEGESIAFVGRIVTGAYYDYQKVRMASMNRIRDIISKKDRNVPFDAVEDKEKVKKYASKYTDAKLMPIWGKLYKDNRITEKEHNYIKKCWEVMQESKKAENRYGKMMKGFIEPEPVHIEFLSKIKGIAHILSANLIKEFGDCRVKVYKKEKAKDKDKKDTWLLIAEEGDEDFHNIYLEAMQDLETTPKIDEKRYKIKGYKNVSKLWAHTGNNVINETGKAPKRQKGKTTSFSPKLRAMTWDVSESLFIHNKGYYRATFDVEKAKQLNQTYEIGVLKEKYGNPYREEDINLKKGHAHNRAKRKIRKIFLDHYWCASRELAGLPTAKSYVEGVLGHTNIITWRDAVNLENTIIKEEK